MPANDELSGANPADYVALAAPSKDTTYSNALARERAIHNIPADADGNAAFHRGIPQVQFPVGELAARGTSASSNPVPVNTQPGT